MDKAIGVWGQQNIKTIGTAEVEDSLLSDHRMPRDERITDKTLALRRVFYCQKMISAILVKLRYSQLI